MTIRFTLSSLFVGYFFLTFSSARLASTPLTYHCCKDRVGSGGTSISGFVSFGASNRDNSRHLLPELSNRRRLLIISSSKSSGNDSTPRSKENQGISSSTFPPIDEAFAQRQISNIFGSNLSRNNKFVPLSLAGRWSSSLPSNQMSQNIGTRIDTIWLSTREECQIIVDAYEQYAGSGGTSNNRVHTTTVSGLPIPLSPSLSQSAMKLLAQTYSSTPLSKSLLLVLNSLLVNRDGGLFDNLPWSTWTVDPARYEKDAADNVLEAKYTMGKRVAYQRFMGKDWKGRSLSLGNLANRLRNHLEKEENADSDAATARCMTEYYEDGIESMVDEGGVLGGDKNDRAMMMLSLSQRLLQLEIKEATMDIAECEQQLAIISTANSRRGDEVNDDENGSAFGAMQLLEAARERLRVAESSLKNVVDESLSFPSMPMGESNNAKHAETKGNNTNARSLLLSILGKFAEQDNPPPYRGAIGYPPKLDSKEEMFQKCILPYSSPYELLLEIIDEQLNSFVIGCVLEQTSLLEGNLVLGGALLLQRKGVPKSSTLLGEMVSYTDEDDDLGNDGVLPNSMYVVECFSDEAVGMALASGVPIFIEESLYERAGGRLAQLDVELAASFVTKGNIIMNAGLGEAMNRIPFIRPLDESFLPPQTEGERVASERESSFVRIPRTTNPSVFDRFPPITSSATRRSVFSTFSPVRNLDEYDKLTDDAKVRLLLKLESFTGSLPRPRAVRASLASASREYDNGTSPPSILDELLVPLIDESIRRQYRIRDAERRKDYAEADLLRAKISPRKAALENAQRARDEGLMEKAALLEEEAELYKALRADVTQDELAYDRFLDRDEWYERETRARLKRMDKSKFRTLLDGVDLP